MYDVIILGSGPAGLTAAIYTTRANLKTLVIAGEKWGGQLMLTTEVENFPGFPEGIQGPDLMSNMRKQAEHHGAKFVDVNFASGDFLKSPFTIQAGEKSYQGKAIIIATGADTKWLDIPGEKEKIGRGVSSCAPCDAPFFRNKYVMVAGGGDSAMEEAIVLTRFAEQVTIIHRRDQFRASSIMFDKAKANPKIKFILNAQITEILGDIKVTGVKIKNNVTNEEVEMPTDGVFVAIGHIPNSKVFPGIDIDEKGFIKVYKHTKTNKEGVFVAGDVHDRQYMQAITAAGFGCAAALEAERWVEEQK
ncbi:MAG TPA: thioredoxin-disulfide reductase [Candidatus Sulfotelmatobacter sp.]|jgi:thioredoxin reductase (NADPH)|nr:thioredoxin-disulfide reductase [Candidatus Sulfotelmatobacter sp.]